MTSPGNDHQDARSTEQGDIGSTGVGTMLLRIGVAVRFTLAERLNLRPSAPRRTQLMTSNKEQAESQTSPTEQQQSGSPQSRRRLPIGPSYSYRAGQREICYRDVLPGPELGESGLRGGERNP